MYKPTSHEDLTWTKKPYSSVGMFLQWPPAWDEKNNSISCLVVICAGALAAGTATVWWVKWRQSIMGKGPPAILGEDGEKARVEFYKVISGTRVQRGLQLNNIHLSQTEQCEVHVHKYYNYIRLMNVWGSEMWHKYRNVKDEMSCVSVHRLNFKPKIIQYLRADRSKVVLTWLFGG